MKKMLLSSCIALALAFAAPSHADSPEADVRAAFQKFVAAQNAHDLAAVTSMLWKSPEMLFFSRGLEVRGADAVAERFKSYYQGTWHLEPDMANLRTAALSDAVVQILVPIEFTRGLPGGEPERHTFLISQSFVKQADGWHVASILPIANTQIK